MDTDQAERRARRAETKRRYSQSEKGRRVHKEAMQRYLATEAGKQAQQRALSKYRAKQLTKVRYAPSIDDEQSVPPPVSDDGPVLRRLDE